MSRPRQLPAKLQLAERIREAYENLPYPAGAELEPPQRASTSVPVDWVYAIAAPKTPDPGRVLVAGCGTGAEAFSLRQHFPQATIVAIDFSGRSLAIARKLQRQIPAAPPIRFIKADLADRNLKKRMGQPFDLISCHGVLSYVPDAAGALRNIASCLGESGVLYLGVNGSRHFSSTWKPALRALGFETSKLENLPVTRAALRVCDALADQPIGWMAKESAEYLRSDLFAPLITNWPLQRWNMLCRKAGLHFLGSHDAQRTLRGVIARDLLDQLRPRARPELHELAELIRPSEFHRLVFARKASARPPWDNALALQHWRVHPTVKLPSRQRTRRPSPLAFRHFTVKSPETNTIIDLHAPQWLLWILSESDGARSVADILADVRPRISKRSLCRHLYLLYVLAAINLEPPGDARLRPS